uniref:Sigma-70 family RNA polymerase sigma factor n=1 Tax=Streptomyces rochei TaxID=1928 RepID=F2Z8V2_STRRO|nr:hypothetical protein [Streptomyces rochei]
MKPAPPTVAMLTNAFYAFYDLHRPAYHAYATARLPREEAELSVTHLFNLIASHWTWVITRECPSAWAWEEHTRTVGRRAGHTPTQAEDTALLHDDLHLSIDRIATITGTAPGRVTALLAEAHRPPHPPAKRHRNPAPCPQPHRTTCCPA